MYVNIAKRQICRILNSRQKLSTLGLPYIKTTELLYYLSTKELHSKTIAQESVFFVVFRPSGVAALPRFCWLIALWRGGWASGKHTTAAEKQSVI